MEIQLPDHISFSQIKMFLRCQRAWYFRYVRGLKIPPSGAIVVGSSVHEALRHLNISLLSERLPPKDEVLDVYSQAFEALARDAIWDSDEPGEAKDGGYKGVETYYETHATVFQPEAVEEELRIPLPGIGVELLGYADLRDRSKLLVDYKTTCRKPSQVGDDVKAQLATYELAYLQLGIEVEKAEVVYIVTSKRNPTVVRHPVEHTSPSEVARWLTMVAQVRQQMEEALTTGRLLPAAPGEWWCSPTWCGYWEICHREF